MAVENDYSLLVHNLNELAKTISDLRDESSAAASRNFATTSSRTRQTG